MSVLLFKQDLDGYSDADILTIANYYNIDADLRDLRWLIAIRHADKRQMLPGDPFLQARVLKDLDDDDLLEMCNVDKESRVACAQEFRERYPNVIRGTPEETINHVLGLRDLQSWLKKYGRNYTIDELAGLRKLSLPFKKIGEIPGSFGGLKNLRTLWLTGNKIRELPESIGELKNLQTLWLNDNEIRKFPEWIGELKNLQYLTLDNNGITKLPESFGELASLRRLSLTNTGISEETISKLREQLPNTEIRENIRRNF